MYKVKCDPLVSDLYRAIKILQQPIKVLESAGKENDMSCVN